jgi:hypothetical protein
MTSAGFEAQAVAGWSAAWLTELRNRVVSPWLLTASGVLAIVALAGSWLHYDGSWPGNAAAWAAWLLGMVAIGGAFVRPGLVGTSVRRLIRGTPLALVRSDFGIGAACLAIYLVSHLWNLESSPWNANGLFDDAAWDLYFARTHAFVAPYQAAFFDDVGRISRETLFHYVITGAFSVFGFNLPVFNGVLLGLGAVTVVFTTLAVHRLTASPAVALVSAVALNLFPLHYLHVFVGHRYAIAAPLMAVSLYYLYSGFELRSGLRLALSGTFAALCLGSAVMGKQYILGLLLAAVLVPIADRRRWQSTAHRTSAVIWLAAFAIAATPLLAYVSFNTAEYLGREGGLLREFTDAFATSGLEGVRPYFEALWGLFFASDTFARQWLHDYPLIPLAWYPLVLGGLVVALVRRRFEIAFLATIPIASALLATPYDFRVLLAAPIWIIAMGLALDAALRAWASVRSSRTSDARSERPVITGFRVGLPATALALLVLGIVPSAAYLWDASREPHSRYLLDHGDVAVARVLQDVAAGSTNPTASVKPDELRRTGPAGGARWDVMACPGSAYAVAHAFLQGFDDRRILAFCDGLPQALLRPEQIVELNTAALRASAPSGRALKLIWEEHPNAAQALAYFRSLEIGSWTALTGSVDGQPWRLHVLTVPARDVERLQQQVAGAPA